jgi:hypothetical protein
MKVNPKGSAKYLAKEDLAVPRIVTMTDVRQQHFKNSRGEDDQLVLYFAGDVKPLVLRPVNRKIIIAAYGDESDLWRGKPIEIYVDPNITMGSDTVGGIRVRIPAAPRPANGRAPTPAPAASRPTVADFVAQALGGMGVARTVENLDEWAQWAKGIRDMSADQQADLEHAYHSAKQRIDAANRRPASKGAR